MDQLGHLPGHGALWRESAPVRFLGEGTPFEGRPNLERTSGFLVQKQRFKYFQLTLGRFFLRMSLLRMERVRVYGFVLQETL